MVAKPSPTRRAERHPGPRRRRYTPSFFTLIRTPMLAPYGTIGESWGMVWFIFNLPLSLIMKPFLWPLARLWVYVPVVTVLNRAILVFIIRMVRDWMRGKKSTQ